VKGTLTADLVRQFRQFMPADAIIDQTESQHPFESDALLLYRDLPLLVVLPETVEQVQRIMRCCHQLGVPVVARGSGTGLAAGAMPHPEGVLLGLSKLSKILEIDAPSGIARVQSGVSNLSISHAAAEFGLYYGPDPSSQIACSIGGNVAENSGGVHCLKYGLTVHNILSIEMITVEGERITLGSRGLDSPGYDLMALMTGSEGLLGVVVEVTVRLLPVPEVAQIIMAGFDSIDGAATAVNQVIAAGIIPAGLEMMDALAIQAAEDFAQAGYPRDAKALLLCELDGTAQEVQDHIIRVETVFRNAGATSVTISRDEDERALLWKGRKSAFPAIARLAPDYYCMDGTIPRNQLAYVLNEISRMGQESGIRVANVFHAGDGNLHPLILFDASDPEDIRRAEQLGRDILELSVQVGGSITGEHGVGLEKLGQMPLQFSAQELNQLEDVKHAFDPKLTLNPGKGIPILKRCQEYKALPPGHNHG
jgi:glycolate oxidase